MKKLFIFSLIIPFSLSLSACGKSEEQKKTTSAIQKIETGKNATLTDSESAACHESKKCQEALTKSLNSNKGMFDLSNGKEWR